MAVNLVVSSDHGGGRAGPAGKTAVTCCADIGDSDPGQANGGRNPGDDSEHIVVILPSALTWEVF